MDDDDYFVVWTEREREREEEKSCNFQSYIILLSATATLDMGSVQYTNDHGPTTVVYIISTTS